MGTDGVRSGERQILSRDDSSRECIDADDVHALTIIDGAAAAEPVMPMATAPRATHTTITKSFFMSAPPTIRGLLRIAAPNGAADDCFNRIGSYQ
jgi:hypothetical protein